MQGGRGFSITHILQLALLFLLCYALTPVASQDYDYSFYPSAAPSPFSSPEQSCPSLSSIQDLLKTTTTDCYFGADYVMDNAICCPQYRTTWKILLGQLSRSSGMLALDQSQVDLYLTCFDSALENQGTDGGLGARCSILPPNLTQGSCPVITVSDLESTVGDTSTLLGACGNVNAMECCTKNCQNAISAAASKLAVKGTTAHRLGKLNYAMRINDCTNIVNNWLAAKLNPSVAVGLFRTLEICQINKACPLYLDDLSSISNACGGRVISNKASCCDAMVSYSYNYLQSPSVVTTTQAQNCAATLGTKLQKVNVTQNVYKLCHITLKNFTASLGGDNCLLPNDPRDATFDPRYGVRVNCETTYQNVVAAWPPANSLVPSPCHKKVTP